MGSRGGERSARDGAQQAAAKAAKDATLTLHTGGETPLAQTRGELPEEAGEEGRQAARRVRVRFPVSEQTIQGKARQDKDRTRWARRSTKEQGSKRASERRGDAKLQRRCTSKELEYLKAVVTCCCCWLNGGEGGTSRHSTGNHMAQVSLSSVERRGPLMVFGLQPAAKETETSLALWESGMRIAGCGIAD